MERLSRQEVIKIAALIKMVTLHLDIKARKEICQETVEFAV